MKIQIEHFINYGIIQIQKNTSDEDNIQDITNDMDEIIIVNEKKEMKKEERNVFEYKNEKTEELPNIDENEFEMFIPQAQKVSFGSRRLSTYMNTMEQSTDFMKLNNRKSSLNYLQEEINLNEIQKECFILFDSYQHEINTKQIYSQLQGRTNLYFILLTDETIFGWFIPFGILSNQSEYHLDNLQNEKELYFFSGNDIMKLKKEYLSKQFIELTKTYFILNNQSIQQNSYLCEWKNLFQLSFDSHLQLELHWTIPQQLSSNSILSLSTSSFFTHSINTSQQNIPIHRLFIYSL